MAARDKNLPYINWDKSFIASRWLVRRQWAWRFALVLAVGLYGLWMTNWAIVAASVGGLLVCIRKYVTQMQLIRRIMSEECFDTEKFRQMSRETMQQKRSAP